ncbi:MAG: T9SS type A sorting domain-containing protein [Bacteroidota bacterium]
MNRAKYIIISLFTVAIILSATTAKSQEQLCPLGYNSTLINLKNAPHQKSNIDITVPIKLPFFDDFSSNSVYPSLSHWIDSSAFVNNTYPVNPPTIGVATFDAIDKYGAHYTNASTSPFVADKLTSRLIRLDSTLTGIPSKITLGDSLYFSFFFQPQGIANNPDPGDSLVLEFLSFPPDTIYIEADTTQAIVADTIIFDRWVSAWSHKGISYANFKAQYGKDFLHVMVPILDNAYLRKDFQFRFKNYASIANTQQSSWGANSDQWNIDYVYLNKGRTINDTIIDDVAITKPQTSILSTYQSMPWSHFLVNPTNEMKTSLTTPYSNLGGDTKNVKREFFINDLEGTGTPYYYTGGNLNLLPFETIDFSPSLAYSFASNTTEKASFEVITSVNTTPDFNRVNDTTRFIQKFDNYYAYDDGTAELGYGLNVKFGKIAYKFNARKADTLRGVDIFFNQVFNNANVKYFYLTVWSSLSPEQIIYQESGYLPKYTDSLNQYRFYRLSDSNIVVNGDFYVGIMQASTDNLNIGFDKNSESGWNSSTGNDLLKYNINGTWMNSLNKGALMIRPVVGNRVPIGVGISDNKKDNISIYPNPANEILNIKSDNIDNTSIDIIDLSGRTILTEKGINKIDISSINPGYYLVVVKENSILIKKEKLIIIR